MTKTRVQKNKKSFPIKNIGSIFFIMLIVSTMVFFSKNDTLVYHDNMTQDTLDLLYEDNQGAKLMTSNWEEQQFQQALHRMTHQKVIANKKHGAIQLTPENIDAMLLVLEQNKGKYKEEDFYLSTLKKWKKKDFKNIDDTHDKLRKFLNYKSDKDSRAYSVASKSEEKKFINRVFIKNKEDE